MEDSFLEVRTFVLRLMSGEEMDSAEDIEFYKEWKYEVEKLITLYNDDDDFPITDIELEDF
jgi:hypothetical protein